jgi:hypothetical protein
VFTKPVVNVNVPETVPVFAPLNKEFALAKVTPVEELLLIVTEVKLAVELAVTILFLNTPVPETVCGVVEAETVPLFLKFWKLKVEAVWVNVPLLVKLPPILTPVVGILNSPFALMVNVLIPIVEEFDTYLFVPEAPSIITLSK